MKKSSLLISTAIAFTFGFSNARGQIYISPQIGLKVYGLKGASTENSGGQVSQLGVSDAGGSAFSAGAGLGYELKFPTPIYRLDLEANLAWSSINFFENGYDNIGGSGSFTAAGLSGGTAEIFSLDLMPIHRFVIPDFFISPFAGVGLALNLFDNTNTTGSAPNYPAGTTFAGSSDFQLGLIFFYGAYLDVLPGLKPFIEFKHMLPFSGQYEMIHNVSVPGEGSSSDVLTVQDAPGFFNLNAGVRFEF